MPKDKTKIIRGEWYDLEARKSDDEWILDVLGAPFGSPENKDRQGDYFSPKTDFMVKEGDERPVLYYHGDRPDGGPDDRPQIIGRAKVTKKDEKGLWFEVILDKTKKLAERVWKAAIGGLARASTGSINYLVRRSPDREILTWPIGELTLIDQGQGRLPANDMATVALKSIYVEAELEMPETFIESEELKVNVVQEEESETKRTFDEFKFLYYLEKFTK